MVHNLRHGFHVMVTLVVQVLNILDYVIHTEGRLVLDLRLVILILFVGRSEHFSLA